MLVSYFEDPLWQAAVQAADRDCFHAGGGVACPAAERAPGARDGHCAWRGGLVQVVLVGSVLVLLFQGPLWLGAPVLLAMMGVAGGRRRSACDRFPDRCLRRLGAS